MNILKKLIVNTESKNYPVYVGQNTFNRIHDIIKKQNLSDRIFVIVDKKVESTYGSIIRKTLKSFSKKGYFLSLSVSERIKSFESAERVYSILAKEQFGRDTLILAVGGGTLGDLAGFVASTYMRGIPVIHIPTTLLSAVDSSVGGKTALNYNSVKNLIGTFYQPETVIVDTEFLHSLPRKELISGFGEMIKYSYLTDGKLYDDLLSNYRKVLNKDASYLNKIIYECLKIKATVVSSDEKETIGIRKILNFGHTFAHAFESNSDYKLSHGLAVTAGIIASIHLSLKKGFLNQKQFDHMIWLPLNLKSYIKLKKMTDKEFLTTMLLDKKSQQGITKFVLIKNFGEILVDINVKKNEIIWAIGKTNELLV